MAPASRTGQPAEWMSKLPGRLAWLFPIALLYCDRAAPLLLSPQTGWHFGAAARWVWLSFAAAGAAKGLLATLMLLRIAARPPLKQVQLGPASPADAFAMSAAVKGAAAKARVEGSAGKSVAAATGSPAEQGLSSTTGLPAKAGERQPEASVTTGVQSEQGADVVSLNPADAQALLLRVLAVLTFVAASAAAAARPLTRLIGSRLHVNPVLLWAAGESGAPRGAEILAAACLGPLFWALGGGFAISVALAQLGGGRRSTLLRRLRAALGAGVVIAAAALEVLGGKLEAALAEVLPPAVLSAWSGIQMAWAIGAPSLPMPPRPVLYVFGATAAATGLLAATGPLWASAPQPALGLKQLAAQKRQQAARQSRQLLRKGLWGLLRLVLVPWLAVIGHQLWRQHLAASGAVPKFRTADNEFAVLRKQEGALGEQFTVVQGDHSKARFVLLKAGHSILGGRYTMPSYFANQSIYDVFYIHEGARLMKPDAEASLHIGLGIGMTAKAFAEHGLRTDVIELHPEVPQLAEEFFDWKANGSLAIADAGKVVDDLLKLDPRPEYDIIVHDVFSGGAVPGRLFSPHFLVKLRALTAADGGILVVNFYGDPDAEPAKEVARTLYKVFGNIRAWAEGAPSPTRNLAFFASEQPIRLRAPTKEDELRDGGRATALKRYFLPLDAEDPPEDDGTPFNPREMDLSWLRNHTDIGVPPALDKARLQDMIKTPLRIDGGVVTAADEDAAAHHWRVMRTVMKQVSFWEATC